MRHWLLALCLLGSLSAQAQSPVWALRGAHNTVYLAESVHLLKPGESTLPGGFTRAYADSSELVMEMDLAKLDTGNVAAWMLEHGRYPDGESLDKALGPERYARVLAQATELGRVLKGSGIEEKVFGAKDTSHGKLNDDLGVAGDPATTELLEFVDRALKP